MWFGLERSFLIVRKDFFPWKWWSIGTAAQGGYGIYGEIPNPSGCIPVPPALSEQEEWTGQSPEVPSNAKYSGIPQNEGTSFLFKDLQHFYHQILSPCRWLIAIGDWNTGSGVLPFLQLPHCSLSPCPGPRDDEHWAPARRLRRQAGHHGHGHHPPAEHPHPCPAASHLHRAGCAPQRPGGCCGGDRPGLPGHCPQAHGRGAAG